MTDPPFFEELQRLSYGSLPVSVTIEKDGVGLKFDARIKALSRSAPGEPLGFDITLAQHGRPMRING